MKNVSMRLKAAPIALLLFVSLIFAGCKPSVAGETDSYKANLEHIASMSAEMPEFAAALASVKAKIEAAWAEAEKITDEEKKAEAMSAANDIVEKGFAGQLYELKGMIDEIGEFRSKLSGKTMSNALIAKINDAVDPADEAIDAAHDAMDEGAADEAAAAALIGPVHSKLKASRDKWKSLKDAYDKEQKDRKKKK